MVFRLCAVGITGVFFVLVQIIIIVVALAIVPLSGPVPTAGQDAIPFLEQMFNRLIIVCLVANILGWFLVFVAPVKSSGSTIGMKLFGLRVEPVTGGKNSWRHALIRETFLAILAVTGVGVLLFAVLALFDREELTVWDRLSRTQVVQMSAKFGFVNEVRQRVAREVNN